MNNTRYEDGEDNKEAVCVRHGEDGEVQFLDGGRIQDGEQDLRPGCGCIFEGLWGIKNRTPGLCLKP